MAQNLRVHRTILDSVQCHSANLYQCHHVSKITHTFYRTEQPNKTVTNNHHKRYTRQNCNCPAGTEISKLITAVSFTNL